LPAHRDAEAAVGGGADLPAQVVGQATADADELAEELVGDREVLQPGVEAVPVQDARDVVRRDPLGRGPTDPGSDVLREDADVLQGPSRRQARDDPRSKGVSAGPRTAPDRVASTAQAGRGSVTTVAAPAARVRA